MDTKRTQISRAILARKRTFLSQREWKIVPWEDNPAMKQPMDFLMDIMCDLATLLADIDEKFKKGTELDLLQHQTIKLLEELNVWWREWTTRCPLVCKEIPTDLVHAATVDAEGPLFPSILVYDHFWTGYTLCIHNSIRILLTQALQMLSCKSTQIPEAAAVVGSDPGTSLLLGITLDTKGLAYEMIRSIEYCYVQSTHFLGTACVLFPLDVAYGVLGGNSREAKWLRETKNIKLPRLTGFTVGGSMIK